MKAIILSGGEGSRLRPLTCDEPKPMARLCGRPILEYIMDLLIAHNTEEAAVTLKYLPERITEHFPNGSYKNLKLRFVYEEKPLGTAGGAKNAIQELGDEPVIIISGDAMCDFNLTEAIQYHVQSGSDATMLVYRVNDPREYGLVSCDENGNVQGFIEKPGWGQAVCNRANTGIYIMNREVFDLIPENEKYDFAKDLFPEMLKNGMKLSAYECEGYWCDIGDLEEYARCQRDLLEGQIRCQMPPAAAEGIYVRGDLPEGEYTINPPVYIGENVSIGRNAVVGPYTLLDDGVTVGEDSRIRKSILLKNALTGSGSSLTGAIMCCNSSIKAGASMFEGAVAGAGAVIGKNASVNPRVLIWNGKSIEDGAFATSNVKYGECKKELFDSSGISGECGVELSAELCARLGSAIGSCECGRRIGIAALGSVESKAMKLAIMSGLIMTGASVWDFGECFESQLSYFTAFCGLESGIFVYGNSIKLFGWGGLTLPRYAERQIEASYARGEFLRCSREEYRYAADMRSINMIYQQELCKQATNGVTNLPVSIKSSNKQAQAILTDTINKLGGNASDGDGMLVHLSRSGRTASVFDKELGYVPNDKILAVCCYSELMKGNNIALPYDAPEALNRLAAEFGKTPLRYLSSPADKSDLEARKLSIRQPWLRDGLFMVIRLLGIMRETECTLAELLAKLPDYATSSITISLDFPVSRLAEFLGYDDMLDNGSEGMLLKNKNGRVLVNPSKDGKRIKVLAEADRVETAQELCIFTADKITKQGKSFAKK